MVLTGTWTSLVIDNSFEDFRGLPLHRWLLAALFVGFGTKIGGGCTSGHAICGIASFRIRSISATCTFMAFGFLTASLAKTSSFLPTYGGYNLTDSRLILILSYLGATGLAAAAGYFGSQHQITGPVHTALCCIMDMSFGALFAGGLVISGMVKPSATISFLDLPNWNPALAAIMCVAIPMAGIFFYFALKNKSPLLDTKFHRPLVDAVTAQMLIGEMIFGIGWGLGGSCPGPAMVNLGTAKNALYPLGYLGAFLAGSNAATVVQAMIKSKKTA